MTRSVCVCLFSGGIDSCLSAVLSKKEHSDIFLLSVNYGQVMQKELAAACELAEYIGAKEHRTVQIVGFEEISRSARTHEALIERNRGGALADGQVPSAYPPGRDFTFLSMAGAWAESVVLSDPEMYDQASIVIGTNRTDGLDYPDCQKRVYELFSNMLTESLKMSKVLGKRISVDTPLITLTKQEVVALGYKVGIPLKLTWSCYYGRERACGVCDACRIRYWAFRASGLNDPIKYEVKEVIPLYAFDHVTA